MKTGQVGQLYELDQGKMEEKVTYRLDRDGHGLVIVKEGITNQEVENIQHGAVELGIYIDGPIIFLLFKFGPGEWNDAPFSWHTVPRGIRVYPQEAAEPGVLKVALVDATDGIVRAMRDVVLTEDFSSKLNEVITVQANGSFNGLSYAKHLNMMYNQYTAQDMVELGEVHRSSQK